MDKQKTMRMKRRLLDTLTIVQVACLWSILDEDSQIVLINFIVEDSVEDGIELWNLLNHDKRYLLIKQLEI